MIERNLTHNIGLQDSTDLSGEEASIGRVAAHIAAFASDGITFVNDGESIVAVSKEAAKICAKTFFQPGKCGFVPCAMHPKVFKSTRAYQGQGCDGCAWGRSLVLQVFKHSLQFFLCCFAGRKFWKLLRHISYGDAYVPIPATNNSTVRFEDAWKSEPAAEKNFPQRQHVCSIASSHLPRRLHGKMV
jgi:hypothetical protein